MNNPYLPKAYEILSVVKETAIDWTFEVAFDGDLIGGQFMQLSIPGVGEAPISISDFTPGHLFMTIRKVGRLTDVIFDLKPGQHLMMRGPYGNGFDLRRYYGKDLLVIAGGTGLAPVKNVIKHMLAPETARSLSALLGFKSPQDMLFTEEVLSWQKKAKVMVTVDQQPKEPWDHLVGLVTEHIPSLQGKNPKETEVIVVGPPMMMKFTTLALLKAGYLKENITVSFERNMSCGIGKCGHCKIDEVYVCLEGPVFNYTQAVTLLD